jgi:predicted metalloendopeptidase
VNPKLLVVALSLAFAAGAHAQSAKQAVAINAVSVSGINSQNMDKSIRPQDDFFDYINGGWLKSTEIPADKSAWGAGAEVAESILPQLRGIVEAARGPNGTEAQKIGDLYASFMDEAALDKLGLKPLDAEFARVDGLKDKKQIPALMAHFSRVGVNIPFDIQVHQDNKDSTKYIVDLGQAGLGLPDRDYYLKDDAKLVEARTKYQAHVEKMLGMSGDKNAAADARAIVALETELAKVQWTKVENRDPIKTYNKVELSGLDALAPGFAWDSWLAAGGLKGKLGYVIVSQPTYITSFNRILQNTPLATWQTYFHWRVLNAYAADLGKPYADENFAFYGTALRGVPQQEARWKRGVRLINGAIGEGLVKLYVDKYFPPENKARMETLVHNLLAAMNQDIDTLDWMGPATKKEAHAKLASFTLKIGYPDRWRDYSALEVAKGDLIGNIVRANEFEYERNVKKLGAPVDRGEWLMTPQTVNAYYNAELNEIVFPAAILQPPFFDVKADDAVNYGSIGAVIGHEISHGFDDQGSQFDGAGNLRDWWTPEDHARFKAKTAALVKQYSSFSPLPGFNINGELTLGENIGDNSGLAIAYKAYHLALNGKEAPVLDGLTGDQRFYQGFAQVWRNKMRDARMIELIKSDPHSMPKFRVLGTLPNQPGFYSAYSVKEGDKMYLPPADRVIIW